MPTWGEILTELKQEMRFFIIFWLLWILNSINRRWTQINADTRLTNLRSSAFIRGSLYFLTDQKKLKNLQEMKEQGVKPPFDAVRRKYGSLCNSSCKHFFTLLEGPVMAMEIKPQRAQRITESCYFSLSPPLCHSVSSVVFRNLVRKTLKNSGGSHDSENIFFIDSISTAEQVMRVLNLKYQEVSWVLVTAGAMVHKDPISLCLNRLLNCRNDFWDGHNPDREW